ncbi:MAG: hypothetical protein QOK37_1367 [Thermoanaerobaculia bacterium]|jgi:uncharacterized protein YecE (DUF72 family)|nr:hypothetical protein [Thermoanaerobaculia bacterium]
MMEHRIRVGPAGWSYPDWEGIVYPPHRSKFDHLAYLASFFDTIEINSPFYRIPPPSHAKSWVRRVSANPHFKFTTKIFRGFTHDAEELRADDIKAFRDYLDPLAEADRLGAVLVQYPWSFRNSEESRDRLAQLFSGFAGFPLALEVRHSTFQNPELFRFLDQHNVAWVNIDQPLFHDSVKPSDTMTGPVGYVRLHGRNYEKWFAHGESWERYNYLYSSEELTPWSTRIRAMAEQKETYVITNNHFRGQAIINAVELEESLGMEAKMPPQLRGTYPDRT